MKKTFANFGHPPFPLGRPTWPTGLPRPAPKRRVGLDYDHEWSRRYPVRLARAVLLDDVTRPLARVLAPTTLRGLEYLAVVQAPVIFAANHASHLDTPLVLASLPLRFRHRTVVAAAADHFFDRTWKAALWSFAVAAVPIERHRVSRRSADTAALLVEEGWNLLIFPEGGRSPDGWQQPFRGGAAYLARRTGRPVVPVHLHGSRQVLGKAEGDSDRPRGGSGTEARRSGRLRRAPVTVAFGKPLWPKEGEDARRFGERVERAVSLLGAELRTDYWRALRMAGPWEGPDALMALARGPEASHWRRSWAMAGPAGGDGRRPQADFRRALSLARGRRRRWPARSLTHHEI